MAVEEQSDRLAGLFGPEKIRPLRTAIEIAMGSVNNAPAQPEEEFPGARQLEENEAELDEEEYLRDSL